MKQENNIGTGILAFAKRELTIAGLFDKDADYGGLLAESVMKMLAVFAGQGHSGSSAKRVTDIFNRLAQYEPLTPIQGGDDEWFQHDNPLDGNIVQNSRCYPLFKHKDTRVVTYNDAIVWRTEKGHTYGGWADNISSSQEIRGFPFTPRTFVIDVIEEEVSPDNWDFHVKDQRQLDAVKEYYNFKTREQNGNGNNKTL